MTLSDHEKQSYMRDALAFLIDATSKGRVYQSRWMWRYGIPPVPLWLVCWFVIPLERFRAWKARCDMDDEIPF